MPYVTVADVEGLPNGSGHLSIGSQKLGRQGGHASSRPWPDSTLRGFYHYGDQDDPTDSDAAVELLKEDLGFLKARITHIEHTQSWPTYFPRVSASALGDDHYAKLDRLQGDQNTYYVGSSHTFESVDAVFKYSEYLIDREFPLTSDNSHA
jgi:hypothetical protein